MSNVPKMHNSARVQAFLYPYLKAWELTDAHPAIGDILTGTLELKTAGDSSTRSMSRAVLFHVLQCCGSIHVDAIDKATNRRYAYRSLASYSAAARVASKAIDRYLDGVPPKVHRLTIQEERQLLDAPYKAELLALGLI